MEDKKCAMSLDGNGRRTATETFQVHRFKRRERPKDVIRESLDSLAGYLWISVKTKTLSPGCQDFAL
jgi:hypothetical protein